MEGGNRFQMPSPVSSSGERFPVVRTGVPPLQGSTLTGSNAGSCDREAAFGSKRSGNAEFGGFVFLGSIHLGTFGIFGKTGLFLLCKHCQAAMGTVCRYARTHRHLAIKLSVSDPLTENGSWMFYIELIRCTRPQNYMRGE